VVHDFIVAAARDSSEAAAADSRFTEIFLASALPLRITQVLAIADWNKEAGYWKGIDPGLGEEMKARFVALGLADLLH
jgi:hypothetical protein